MDTRRRVSASDRASTTQNEHFLKVYDSWKYMVLTECVVAQYGRGRCDVDAGSVRRQVAKRVHHIRVLFASTQSAYNIIGA